MINNKNYTRDQLKEILEDELFQNLLFHTANMSCFRSLNRHNKSCLKSDLTEDDLEYISMKIQIISKRDPKPSDYFSLVALCYLINDIEKSIDYLEKFLEIYDKPVENNLIDLFTEYAFKAADYTNIFEEEEDTYMKASYLIDTGNYHETILILDKLLKSSNNDKKATILYLLVLCYFHVNKIDKFKEIFNEFLLLYPDDLEIHKILGAYYYSIEDYEKSIESYNLAKDYFYKHLPEVNDNKNNAYNYIGLIGCYKKIGRIDELIQYFEKRLSVNPDNEVIWTYLAMCYQEKDEYDKAFEVINKALSIEPYNDLALSALALNYYHKESYNKAIYYFKECIRVNYKDLNSYKILGLTYIKIKDFDNAIKIFKFILNIWSKNGHAYFALSKIYEHLGQNNLSSECFDKASKLKPFNISEYPKIVIE